MNIKISKNMHDRLSELEYKEYLFGSRLHGLQREDSDYDYIRLIPEYELYYPSQYLPNIHPLQYDGDGCQYVWTTDRQFWGGLFTGDNNIVADILLYSPLGEFPVMKLCRAYKIMKSYLGMVKRDLKDLDRKRNHVLRGLYTVSCLINNELPTREGLRKYIDINSTRLSVELSSIGQDYINEINIMLDKEELSMYPSFYHNNDISQLILDSNNIKEFKYETNSIDRL